MRISSFLGCFLCASGDKVSSAGGAKEESVEVLVGRMVMEKMDPPSLYGSARKQSLGWCRRCGKEIQEEFQ